MSSITVNYISYGVYCNVEWWVVKSDSVVFRVPLGFRVTRESTTTTQQISVLISDIRSWVLDKRGTLKYLWRKMRKRGRMWWRIGANGSGVSWDISEIAYPKYVFSSYTVYITILNPLVSWPPLRCVGRAVPRATRGRWRVGVLKTQTKWGHKWLHEWLNAC